MRILWKTDEINNGIRSIGHFISVNRSVAFGFVYRLVNQNNYHNNKSMSSSNNKYETTILRHNKKATTTQPNYFHSTTEIIS